MPEVFHEIRIDRDEPPVWITLNRPAVFNAFNLGRWREVTAALRDAEADPSIRVAVLQGSEENFSSGYDLTAAMSELGGSAPDDWRDYITLGNETCWTAWRLRKPAIALVRGYCLGGAFELAMACDFVLAGRDAKFGEPEVRFSDAPPFLISPWVMGMRQAKDLLLTGDIIDAEKALRFGLLTELVENEDLEDAGSRARPKAVRLCGGELASQQGSGQPQLRDHGIRGRSRDGSRGARDDEHDAQCTQDGVYRAAGAGRFRGSRQMGSGPVLRPIDRQPGRVLIIRGSASG